MHIPNDAPFIHNHSDFIMLLLLVCISMIKFCIVTTLTNFFKPVVAISYLPCPAKNFVFGASRQTVPNYDFLPPLHLGPWLLS